MNTKRFNQLVKECIQDILNENYRLICGWCGKVMGDLGPEFQGDSHGICPDCYKKQMDALDLLDPSKQYSNPIPPENPIK
jgi:hypothetical protein